MIINKSKQFCSFLTKSMFNLQEFEFSNVSKTITQSVSLTVGGKKTKSGQNVEVIQSSSVNVPVIKNTMNKKKSKKVLEYDPCKTYEKIRQWRKGHVAPVDTMGCDVLSEPTQSQSVQKYQTLISLMLSIQTTDQITSMVVKRLQQHGLTPQNIAQTPQSQLVQLIHESNFNKRKAKNIIEVSKRILQQGLPKNQQELLKLPGIGVKIAMIYLRAAEGVLSGIGVDTHVHRISNRLGWIETSNPNLTEIKLQETFPKKYWTDINLTLVGFGQIMCNAKKPLCHECPVNLQCPSACQTKQKKLQW